MSYVNPEVVNLVMYAVPKVTAVLPGLILSTIISVVNPLLHLHRQGKLHVF